MEENIILNNGKKMPMIGFGVYQIPSSITERCVNEALETGYKLIDTAQCYGNETEVGFKNRSHFSTAYKKQFGHSPALS